MERKQSTRCDAYFPKCHKDCLGYCVNGIFTIKYSTYITIPHSISDEDFSKSEKSISKNMLKPTVILFTQACGTLHNISFYLQLMEASFDSFDEKKTGLKCIFLDLKTIQLFVGICFRILKLFTWEAYFSAGGGKRKCFCIWLIICPLNHT